MERRTTSALGKGCHRASPETCRPADMRLIHRLLPAHLLGSAAFCSQDQAQLSGTMTNARAPPAAAAIRAAPLCHLPSRLRAPMDRWTDRRTARCLVSARRAERLRQNGKPQPRHLQSVKVLGHVLKDKNSPLHVQATLGSLPSHASSPSAPLCPCKQQLRLAGSCALICGGLRKTKTPRVFQINSLSYPLEACQRATVSLKIKYN